MDDFLTNEQVSQITRARIRWVFTYRIGICCLRNTLVDNIILCRPIEDFSQIRD